MQSKIANDNGVNETGIDGEVVEPGRYSTVKQGGPGRNPFTASYATRHKRSKLVNTLLPEQLSGYKWCASQKIRKTNAQRMEGNRDYVSKMEQYQRWVVMRTGAISY